MNWIPQTNSIKLSTCRNVFCEICLYTCEAVQLGSRTDPKAMYCQTQRTKRPKLNSMKRGMYANRTYLSLRKVLE